jgi:dTDP-4-dehydrorhamnose reductase
MKILVTGAYGQLGREMQLVEHNAEDSYIFTDKDTLDITDAAAVEQMVLSEGIDVVVNCAAYTNVELAEDEEDIANVLNCVAVENLATAMAKVGGVLIHVSTDYVFGGNVNNTPISETESVNPTGAYGRTKLAGEQAVAKSGCRAIVIRTAWLYSEFGKNFVKTLLEVTATQPKRKVVIDQVGTPTYALDLADVIAHIINTRTFECGTYHYSNEGVCSWYDFTKAIHRLAGITTCQVKPLHTSEYPAKAKRPHYSVLDKSKIKATYGMEVPYWMESLEECIEALSDGKE